MEVTPHEEARILLGTSLTLLVSCSFASALRLWDCLLTASLVLFCSLNYWRRPVYGLRRNIDIINFWSGLVYQLGLARSVSAIYSVPYIVFTFLALMSFASGYKFSGRKATLCHSGGHILGNVANMFLYPGLVKLRRPLNDVVCT